MPAIHDYLCPQCQTRQCNIVHPIGVHPLCPICGHVLEPNWESGEAPGLETYLVHEGRTINLPGVMPDGKSDIIIQDKAHLRRIERDASREAGKELKIHIP